MNRIEYLVTWAAAERGITSQAAREFFANEASAAGESLADYLEGHLDGATACGAQVLYASTGLGVDDSQLCLPCLMAGLSPSALSALLSTPSRITSADFDASALTTEQLADTSNSRDTVKVSGVTYRVCGRCGSGGQG